MSLTSTGNWLKERFEFCAPIEGALAQRKIRKLSARTFAISTPLQLGILFSVELIYEMRIGKAEWATCMSFHPRTSNLAGLEGVASTC
jgi:hypothetical protein